MKLVVLGLIAAFAVWAWFRGGTGGATVLGLVAALALGLLALAQVPIFSADCSLNDVLFLSEPWHVCTGMAVGYGLVAYALVGLIRRVATNE
jgi:glycerol-3-phosphate acyltransferase PlsY